MRNNFKFLITKCFIIHIHSYTIRQMYPSIIIYGNGLWPKCRCLSYSLKIALEWSSSIFKREKVKKPFIKWDPGGSPVWWPHLGNFV